VQTISQYIDKFLRHGKVIVRTNVDHETDKKLFKSVVEAIQTTHPKLIENCKREKMLSIDDRNCIIEVILLHEH